MYVFFHGQILVFLNISKFQPPPLQYITLYILHTGRSVGHFNDLHEEAGSILYALVNP